jgi:Mce-associated membrane protein
MTLHDSDAEAAVTDAGPGSSADEVGAFARPVPGRHGGRRAAGSSALDSLRGLLRPVPMLVAALVASLVLAGWLGLQVRSDNREDSDRRAVVAAAESAVLSLTSYDHAKLDEDFAAATGKLTQGFKGDFTPATTAFRELITQLHAKATATVLNAGLVSYGDDRAEVLFFIDQTVTNDSLKAPRLDRSRMRVTLEKHDGRWLVSGAFLV